MRYYIEHFDGDFLRHSPSFNHKYGKHYAWTDKEDNARLFTRFSDAELVQNRLHPQDRNKTIIKAAKVIFSA